MLLIDFLCLQKWVLRAYSGCSYVISSLNHGRQLVHRVVEEDSLQIIPLQIRLVVQYVDDTDTNWRHARQHQKSSTNTSIPLIKTLNTWKKLNMRSLFPCLMCVGSSNWSSWTMQDYCHILRQVKVKMIKSFRVWLII